MHRAAAMHDGRLRIGINALFLALGKIGGMETYIRRLMHALPPLAPEIEFLVFVDRANAGSFLMDRYPNVREICCTIPAPPNRRAQWGMRVTYESLVLPVWARRHALDLLYSPVYTGPAPRGIPSVLMLPDMLFEDLPEVASTFDRVILTRLIRRSVRAAAHILTLSDFIKGRIETVYGVDPDQITVTPLAANPVYAAPVNAEEIARVCAAHGIQPPYVLSVATLLRHKNLELLLDAFADLLSTWQSPVQLVLVGRRAAETAALQSRIATHGLEGQVIVTGYVPDSDLPPLYQGASLFVLPSRYEGFGIPVLEAMASGTPVVTTTAASLPEVAGDAALLVAPNDRAALTAAMRRLLCEDDLRAALVDLGRAQERRFTWEATAETTLAAFRACHARAKRGAN